MKKPKKNQHKDFLKNIKEIKLKNNKNKNKNKGNNKNNKSKNYLNLK